MNLTLEEMNQLEAVDVANGLPVGTMRAIMQIESGGRYREFINAPDTYHYGLNDQGRRIAEHTGQISTAAGPFGILDSTARNPGYGVRPLTDRASFEENIRFAGEYVSALANKFGGLNQGLARYGEGSEYANKILKLLDMGDQSLPVDNQVAQNNVGNNLVDYINKHKAQYANQQQDNQIINSWLEFARNRANQENKKKPAINLNFDRGNKELINKVSEMSKFTNDIINNMNTETTFMEGYKKRNNPFATWGA